MSFGAPIFYNTLLTCIASDQATGQGVERGGIWEALSQLLEDTEYWQKADQFYVPAFATDTGHKAKHITYWESFGFLYGLHFCYYGSNIHDISPFLPIALTSSKDVMCLKEEFIGALDPDSALMLPPWMQLNHNQPMPSGPSAMQQPVNQFILVHCDE